MIVEVYNTEEDTEVLINYNTSKLHLYLENTIFGIIKGRYYLHVDCKYPKCSTVIQLEKRLV